MGNAHHLEFGHFFFKVILGCAHFLDLGRFEYDNAYECEYGSGSRGWHWQLVASVAQQQEAAQKKYRNVPTKGYPPAIVVDFAFIEKPIGLRPPATS